MSEKTKTPREMAREKYPQDIATTDEAYMYSYNGLQEERQEAYLAGLEAGAKMGWEADHETYTDSTLENGQPCQIVSPIEFDEWWASLEGEKSST